MQEFILQYIIQIILGGISRMLGLLSKHHYTKLRMQSEVSEKKFADKEKEDKMTREGVIVSLHMRLYELCQECINQGYVTTEELKNVEEVYKTYHAHGGNGTGTSLYNRILALPIDKDRKEE